MTPATGRDLEREIAQSLVGALEVALGSGSTAGLRAARDAAQLLELPGLDRLIAALAPHTSRPWPAEVRPAVERLQRVCARAAAGGGVAEFRSADTDFHGLAGEIVALEWSSLPTRGGAPGPTVPTLGVAEMLTDLTLASESSAAIARRVRLTMPVAAAVRAALDWLAGPEGVRAPLELREDASALEIICELRDAAGIRPAHEVLSAVDGNLGPPLGPWNESREGAWAIRVPAFNARPAYVMLEQGQLRLAVPWHAVLRLQVAPRDTIAVRAGRMGMSVLPRLSPLTTRATECPVVIVAHGLKRAWLVADRLVWRLPADLCEPDARLAAAGFTRAVSTDEGEIFALAEPLQLLAGALLPPLPRVAPRRTAFAPPPPPARREPQAIEVLDERWVTPLPAPEAPAARAGEEAPAAQSAPAATGAPAPTQARVEPAAAPETPEPAPVEPGPLRMDEPVPPRMRAPGAGPVRPAQMPAPAPRRALIAEDSITARIFLARLLEQHGFQVITVERAAELNAALRGGAWSLVCVDVELPDALGAALLRSVRDKLPEATPLVALARDEHDVAVAREAGVWRTLLKPVESGALRRLLARLGLVERASG